MKNKYFFIKVFGIVFLIMVVILYLLLYFLPSIKEISRYKRQLKDRNLKVADFVKMENAFTFSNEHERSQFKQLEQKLAGRVPEVRSREDFISLFTKVSDYVQNLAKKDGIFNLVITSDSKEIKVKTGSLASDKKSLDDLLSYSSQRLSILRRKMEMEERNSQLMEHTTKPLDIGDNIAKLVKGVKYQTVWLSFTGQLKNVLNLINHLPWSQYYLSVDKVIVSQGDFLPYCIISLRIYYVDFRPNNDKGTAQ
jgi:predicted Holliday junction resolvase-like endonuclease